MTLFNAQPVLDGLKEFQRRTVDHVFDQFYREGSRHFLVADETGLGKSVVARGLVARTIEHLQHDDGIDQIDVVYVCSNADLARQNLKRLNVTGHEQHQIDRVVLGVACEFVVVVRHARQVILRCDAVAPHR